MSVADARQSSVVRVDALIARVLESPALKEDALRSYLAAHRSHADELLIRLKDQSERMLVIDTASAEVLANALLWAAEHLDDARFRALGGIALGDVRRAQGRYADAIGVLDMAGQAFLALLTAELGTRAVTPKG